VSGDDIGEELVLQRGDLVLELQFAALQARNVQLVNNRFCLEQGYLGVEFPMLGAKLRQLLTNISLVLTLHP
jgi:hypothetical protein